jgi:hypothetical protein
MQHASDSRPRKQARCAVSERGTVLIWHETVSMFPRDKNMASHVVDVICEEQREVYTRMRAEDRASRYEQQAHPSPDCQCLQACRTLLGIAVTAALRWPLNTNRSVLSAGTVCGLVTPITPINAYEY